VARLNSPEPRSRIDPEKLRETLELAVEANEPVLVDVLCQRLEEARDPVSEWIA
jgi:hypothetical protein